MITQQRQLQKGKLVIATGNAGKLKEFSDFFSPLGLNVVSIAGEAHARGQSWQAPDEIGENFADNARIKAKAAAHLTDWPVLADDSGLSVHALNGRPGLYSARWAGPQQDYQQAMERILEALDNQADRTATFICALAVIWPDGYKRDFQGQVDGHIAYTMRGQHGFGYDPVFIAKGYDKTFAEMDTYQKTVLSHRYHALTQMAQDCITTRHRSLR